MNDADQSVGEHADAVCRAGAGSKFVGGRHPGSPLSIAVNTPASIIPAILAGRTQDVVAPTAAETAWSRGWPENTQTPKIAQPGGGARTTTTRTDRGIR